MPVCCRGRYRSHAARRCSSGKNATTAYRYSRRSYLLRFACRTDTSNTKSITAFRSCEKQGYYEAAAECEHFVQPLRTTVLPPAVQYRPKRNLPLTPGYLASLVSLPSLLMYCCKQSKRSTPSGMASGKPLGILTALAARQIPTTQFPAGKAR